MEKHKEQIKITDKEFCNIHTNIYGEIIDNPKQIAMIKFNGEELKDYTESVLNSKISERIRIEYAISVLDFISEIGWYKEKDGKWYHDDEIGFFENTEAMLNYYTELKNKIDGK